MINGLVPSYLNSLVPVTIGSTSSYNLRGSHYLQGIACRTNLYLNSFLPSVVTDWNALPIDVRNLDSLSAFKRYINRDKPNPNKLYFFGERKIQVIHARLPTKCSSLHQHLYFRNLINPLSGTVAKLNQISIIFLNADTIMNLETYFKVFQKFPL